MRRLFLFIACFIAIQASAQNNNNEKKAWLGVLTLPEKYQDEKNWTSTDQAVVGEHFRRLQKKKEESIVVLAGRTELPLNDRSMMGLVVFYAKDEKEALQFMMDDPAVKAGIMLAKVHPYGLALLSCK